MLFATNAVSVKITQLYIYISPHSYIYKTCPKTRHMYVFCADFFYSIISFHFELVSLEC